MARPQVEIDEQKPAIGDAAATAQSVWELSRAASLGASRSMRDAKTKTAAYTMDPVLDRVILADATGGAFTVTLPDAGEADHTEYTVVATVVSGGNVTVATVAGNINGAATVVLGTQYHGVTVASDGSNYFRTDNL